MRSAVLGFLLALALVFVASVAVVTRGDDTPKPTLSDRINAACPKGYEVNDWQTDGEFTEIPAGTVKVTCIAVNLDHQPQVVYRSVAL